jgi:hypothetical protein
MSDVDLEDLKNDPVRTDAYLKGLAEARGRVLAERRNTVSEIVAFLREEGAICESTEDVPYVPLDPVADLIERHFGGGWLDNPCLRDLPTGSS